MKKCFKCKRILPFNAFYRHKRMADGHLNKCKLCTTKDVSARYNDPIARTSIIAYEKRREKDPQRRAKKIEYQRVRRLKSPGKNRARQKVNNAIRDGRLKRGPCEICGNKKVEAHHKDYRQYLKVNWFCRKHHMIVEGKKPF